MKNRIQELRKQKGLSQRELAKKIGVSFQSISFYERGERTPKLETWIKLANFFNVPVSYIQGTSNIRDPQAFENYESFSTNFDSQDDVPRKEFKAFRREKNLMLLYTMFNELIEGYLYTPEEIKHYKDILNSIDDYKIYKINSDLSQFFTMLLDGMNGDERTLKTLHSIFDILVRDGFTPFDSFE